MGTVLRFSAALLVASCSPAARPPTVTVQPLPVVTESAPKRASERAIDLDFENRIHLVGVRFEPEKAARGAHVTITFRWRCDQAPGDGWQLFTHVVDETSSKTDNFDRRARGIERWEAGTTHVETLDYVIPEWATDKLTVYVGIWKGASRLRVLSGPSDGDNRGISGVIEVTPR